MTQERAKEIQQFLNEKICYFEANEKCSRNLEDDEWKIVVEAVNSDYPQLKSAGNMLGVMAVERYAFSLMRGMGININNEDFAQSARMGIIFALPNFNPDKGRATTYFKPYIRSELMDEFKNEALGPSETRYQQMKKMIVKRAISELEKAGVSEPNAEDIHAYLQKTNPKNNFPVKAIRKTMEDIQPVAGLDELIGVATDKSAADPEKEALKNAEEKELKKLISRLDARSQFIINTMLTWYEMDGEQKKMPFKLLYDAYIRNFDANASQESVKRSQRTALQKLREQLERAARKQNRTTHLYVNKPVKFANELDIIEALKSDEDFFED